MELNNLKKYSTINYTNNVIKKEIIKYEKFKGYTTDVIRLWGIYCWDKEGS